jgi:PAS domain S-box-containing protein
MPGYTGLEVINLLASKGKVPPLIMVTGTGSEKVAVEAMKSGAGDYVVKDIDSGYIDLLPTVIERVLSVHRISEEKQKAENALRDSEKKYYTIFVHIQDVYFEVTIDGEILEISPSIERLTLYKRENLIGKQLDTIYTNPSDFLDVFKTNDKISDFEITLVDKDDSHKICSINSELMRDNNGKPIKIIGSLRNITKRKKAEEKVKSLLNEKELLLKEIHHRVKNNFMVISSLLDLQSENIQDQRAITVFKESHNRIRSMALIHEKLYQSQDLARIDFAQYIKSLADSLYRSYGVSPLRIVLETEIDDVTLGIDKAIPCGLIVNELISNALKYGFPEESSNNGRIKVILREMNEKKIELGVSDNGIGFPKELNFRKTDTLGLQLILLLAEEQLGGKVQLDRTTGTTFKILF